MERYTIEIDGGIMCVEKYSKYLTCCNDVVKLMEVKFEVPHALLSSFSLYKINRIDSEGTTCGYSHILTTPDDKFPVVITNESAYKILDDPKLGYSLLWDYWFKRYRT